MAECNQKKKLYSAALSLMITYNKMLYVNDFRALKKIVIVKNEAIVQIKNKQ